MSSRVSFRSRVGEVLWVLLYRSGLLRLGACVVRLCGGGATRVLCYHRIAIDPRPVDLSAGRFEAHLRHLGRRYEFLPAIHLVRRLRSGERPPANGIVITVDDGYRDFPDDTVAGLAEAGATVFALTAALPDRGRFPGTFPPPNSSTRRTSPGSGRSAWRSAPTRVPIAG